MNSYPSKRQQTIVVIGLILAAVLLIATAAWLVMSGNGRNNHEAVSQSQGESPNDAIREEHAMTLANRLFTRTLVQRQSVPEDQAGLNDIATDRDGNKITDPTTGEPYVFTDRQSMMEPGQAYFRAGATCDNKTADSDGEGMIIDSIEGSVAVTIKLESGGYACQSSL